VVGFVIAQIFQIPEGYVMSLAEVLVDGPDGLSKFSNKVVACELKVNPIKKRIDKNENLE
jgi:hypothetical protein